MTHGLVISPQITVINVGFSWREMRDRSCSVIVRRLVLYFSVSQLISGVICRRRVDVLTVKDGALQLEGTMSYSASTALIAHQNWS